jgi:hypothetical protein
MKSVVTLTVALILLTLSCFEEEGVTPRGPEPPEPTSPANVLKNVVISFNQPDIGLLKAMLNEFYFDPRDVGQSPPGGHYLIPESWSYVEFWNAVGNMFDKAYAINLSLPTDRIGTPGENETTYKADNVSISLLVMIDELDGFIADKGYCNFEFERYESAGGKKHWRLTKWWDRTSQSYDENPGVEPVSLGKVLALFR